MKVGIVTQPLNNNFGGIIQNFALQQALKSLGHEPLTLNYCRPVQGLSARDYLRHLAMFLRIMPALSLRAMPGSIRMPHSATRQPMLDFISRHIAVTEPMSRYSLPKEFDAVITGSDQVWRPRYNDNITDMFLGFAGDSNITRIAYAASFGVDQWEFTPGQTDRCKQLATRFNAISVREESGIRLCREHLGVDATLVLDPTLLLDSTDYLPLCQSIPEKGYRFAGAYIIDSGIAKFRSLNRTARRLGIRAIECNPTTATLPQWLAMFRDASYIVTDSFHGTVFSIIFHKPFTVIGNSARGLARFSSLLEKLGLSDRIATPETGGALPAGEIDWNDVDRRLGAMRASSQEFLSRNLTPYRS